MIDRLLAMMESMGNHPLPSNEEAIIMVKPDLSKPGGRNEVLDHGYLRFSGTHWQRLARFPWFQNFHGIFLTEDTGCS